MTEQQAAYLAGAIAHANDSLDWIEHRQGPLPDDGYARIETSVGVVRALAGRETTVGNEWGIGPLPVALIERQSLKAENARLRERVAAAESAFDSPTWAFVLAFARRMEAKLDQNRHKGDRAGWLAMHPHDLLRRVRDEADELENAILSDHAPEAVWSEAADVANFALMVADSYRHRSRRALAGSREQAAGEGEQQ